MTGTFCWLVGRVSPVDVGIDRACSRIARRGSRWRPASGLAQLLRVTADPPSCALLPLLLSVRRAACAPVFGAPLGLTPVFVPVRCHRVSVVSTPTSVPISCCRRSFRRAVASHIVPPEHLRHARLRCVPPPCRSPRTSCRCGMSCRCHPAPTPSAPASPSRDIRDATGTASRASCTEKVRCNKWWGGFDGEGEVVRQQTGVLSMRHVGEKEERDVICEDGEGKNGAD